MAALSPSVDPPLEPIEFIDLKAQQRRIRGAIDRAIKDVLDSGAYIMGPQVQKLEAELAEFSGAKHAICCSSGTDALLIALMAKGIGRGDAVICPAFTYTATPETIALLGATAVFADVFPETFNLDPAKLGGAIKAAKAKGLKPAAIVAVDLFGQPAAYDEINAFARESGLWVLADAAQSFGATYKSQRVGRLGEITATSFFPAKPLGCYGDGGAIFTDDAALAGVMRSIVLHGKGAEKYDVIRVGINGRLDTIQAAILSEKLKIFSDETHKRQEIAKQYSDALAGAFKTPDIAAEATSVWAQYTLRLPPARRAAVAKHLSAAGVPTNIYYPKPLHHQPAYKDHVVAEGGAGIAEALSNEVLSIPMHPYLTLRQQDYIIARLLDAPM